MHTWVVCVYCGTHIHCISGGLSVASTNMVLISINYRKHFHATSVISFAHFTHMQSFAQDFTLNKSPINVTYCKICEGLSHEWTDAKNFITSSGSNFAKPFNSIAEINFVWVQLCHRNLQLIWMEMAHIGVRMSANDFRFIKNIKRFAVYENLYWIMHDLSTRSKCTIFISNLLRNRMYVPYLDIFCHASHIIARKYV